MDKIEAHDIIRKACKSKKQKEAYALLFGVTKSQYKCHYYHEICSRCTNYPSPEDIEADRADDCCTEYQIAAFFNNQEKVGETGHCRFFIER